MSDEEKEEEEEEDNEGEGDDDGEDDEDNDDDDEAGGRPGGGSRDELWCMGHCTAAGHRNIKKKTLIVITNIGREGYLVWRWILMRNITLTRTESYVPSKLETAYEGVLESMKEVEQCVIISLFLPSSHQAAFQIHFS